MIRFQQIRNATVKLCYPNATFLIDPWLSPTCTPEERDAALHEDKLNQIDVVFAVLNEHILEAGQITLKDTAPQLAR